MCHKSVYDRLGCTVYSSMPLSTLFHLWYSIVQYISLFEICLYCYTLSFLQDCLGEWGVLWQCLQNHKAPQWLFCPPSISNRNQILQWNLHMSQTFTSKLWRVWAGSSTVSTFKKATSKSSHRLWTAVPSYGAILKPVQSKQQWQRCIVIRPTFFLGKTRWSHTSTWNCIQQREMEKNSKPC